MLSSPPQPDPYKALGISKDADLSTIKSTYRKLVLKCHPDKFQDDALKAVKVDEFQKVQQAYELLTDESRRSKYDETIKLNELRKEMGRGGATTTNNVFEYEVRTAEPRSSSFRSSTKVYTQASPRSYEDDIRSSSFDEPRARARKASSYESDRKRPSTRDGEKTKRFDEEDRYERFEKEARRSAQDAAKKTRDRERKKGTQEKFSRSNAAYVEDESPEEAYRSARKSFRDIVEEIKPPREKDSRPEYAPKLNFAQRYMQASRQKAHPEPDYRPSMPRAQTFNEPAYSIRYANPPSPYVEDDDSPRRSSAQRSSARRASEDIPIRSRESPRSSGRERKTSPYERDDVYVVDASPPSPPIPMSKKPPLQTHTSAPPSVPVTSRKEPHRSRTLQSDYPASYTRRESATAPPPLPRASTFQSGDKAKPTTRGSKLRTQIASDDSDSDSPTFSPRSPPSPPRRRDREPEKTIYNYSVQTGRAVPISSSRRTPLREGSYDYVSARDRSRDRSESPHGSSRRPPISRNVGSGSHSQSFRGQYTSTAEPIIKEARPKMSPRESSSSGRNGGSYFGEVKFAQAYGPEHVSYSKDPFRRGSDPSRYQQGDFYPVRAERTPAYA
jgi:curved DNA-binding protein CbpA